MQKRLIFIISTLLILAMLWGCGSSGSGGTQIVEQRPEDVQTVGITNCFICHTAAGAVWLESVHGNSDIQPASLTNPFCLSCHDQLGDGQRLQAAANVPNRPVVSCESCHGGGSAHRGIGPMPFPSPDHTRCGQCHNADFPHTFAPEGFNIVEDYVSSPHFVNSLNSAVLVPGTASDVRAPCSRCHSDQGARLFGASANLANVTPVQNGTPVQCRTCHQPHREGLLLGARADFVGAGSAEFKTCNICHQPENPLFHTTTPERIIADTHNATPGNFLGAAGGANQNDISGYAMDFNNPRVCRDCHNPHNADTTINRQWEQSGHADKSAAGAWAHYNWTEVPGQIRVDTSATADRSTCQRCHTTTGAIAYFAANIDGDPSDFVPPMPYDPFYEPEMLHCNGCHSDSLGGLRGTGPITADYTNAPFQYPDALGSNMCLACHTGRESGDSIKNSPADFSGPVAFINSHYLTAGGTVYGATGFEYDGQDYANVPFFQHDQVGTALRPGTGNQGPCIGCHMSAPESHLFQAIAKDETTGQITEITSPVCAVCHTGNFALTAQDLNVEEEEFRASLEALRMALQNEGIFFANQFPYFFNEGPTTVANRFLNWGNRETMGAAFNFNMLLHDPGAYVHNRFYSKRLIYDSIDFLHNDLLDGSVGTAIEELVANGLLDAGTAEAAVLYLDGNPEAPGIARP
jgi:hypothetical protein